MMHVLTTSVSLHHHPPEKKCSYSRTSHEGGRRKGAMRGGSGAKKLQRRKEGGGGFTSCPSFELRRHNPGDVVVGVPLGGKPVEAGYGG